MTAKTLTDRLFDDDDKGEIDPFALFEDWYEEARSSEANDPHAMAVASVDSAGMPDVRMVLMNAHDRRGFVFFTNFDSRKGDELKAHPEAALVFYQQAEDILTRDLPVLPLRAEQNNFAYSTNVKDVEVDAYNRVVLDKLDVARP